MFDQSLIRLRRARAARIGGVRFLHDRAFDDCLDRLADVRRPFATVLIIAAAGENWAGDAAAALPDATVTAAAPTDLLQCAPGSFDLCLSIGGLEASEDLPTAAFALRHILAPGGLLLGAIVGGNSLPRLRAAMLAADRLVGGASPRIHPTIDGPSLSALLTSVGLEEPVVDVDRVDVSYPSLDRLVADLRAMGCTNALAQRSRRPLSRKQVDIARSEFIGDDDRSIERFELLNFTAWAPMA